MTEFLRQGTAATVKLGPFLDDADGKTAEPGLTIAQADIRLSKNGGDAAQSNNSAGAAHDENGWYDVPLDTTDINTLGRLKVFIHVSGALPVWENFMVLAVNVYDSLFGSDKLQVDTVQIEGSDATDTLGTPQTGDSFPLATAIKAVTDNLPNSGLLTSLATGANLAIVDNVIDDIVAVTDKLNTALELDGAEYRFTTNALEQAPSGTGGDASAANQATIITHLTDIKGATFSGSTDSLEAIRDHGDEAWVTGAGGSAPTVEEIQSYLDANSTQFATLVGRLTAARAGFLDKLNVSGTLAHSDAADTYKADVSGLATLLNTIAGYLDTEIQTLIENTGTTIPVMISELNNISVDDIIAGITDGDKNLAEMVRIGFSIIIGLTGGGGTNTLNFRDVADTKNRAVVTVDANKNRTVVVLDGE